MIRAAHPRTLARWYGETLGVDFDVGDDAGRFARLDTASGPLFIGIVAAPDHMPPTVLSPVTVTFAVREFDAIVERLRPRSEVFRVEEAGDFGRFAYLMDPEGNEIALWDADHAK
jgi:predicted enzyme related to lactoylglutathione lyase